LFRSVLNEYFQVSDTPGTGTFSHRFLFMNICTLEYAVFRQADVVYQILMELVSICYKVLITVVPTHL
jgi:hypothetical protein